MFRTKDRFKPVCNLFNLFKKYTKLIKQNLKLITSINNMWLFLNFTQCSLNFEPSFVRIHQVLKDIWLFEHKFQARNFDQLPTFGGIKLLNKLFIKLLNSFRFLTEIETGK